MCSHYCGPSHITESPQRWYLFLMLIHLDKSVHLDDCVCFVFCRALLQQMQQERWCRYQRSVCGPVEITRCHKLAGRVTSALKVESRSLLSSGPAYSRRLQRGQWARRGDIKAIVVGLFFEGRSVGFRDTHFWLMEGHRKDSSIGAQIPVKVWLDAVNRMSM